jgi:delta 1-pyrroline-5-carboxylate dehydrogenase
VEADDTSDEAGDGDAGTGPDAGGAAKSRRMTRSAVRKQLTSAVVAAVSAVKAAKKKRRGRGRRLPHRLL